MGEGAAERFGERRFVEVGEVLAEVIGVAGAGEDDVDAGLVGAESVGGFGECGGVGLLEDEGEGVFGVVDLACVEFAGVDEVADGLAEGVGVGEGAADGEHVEGAGAWAEVACVCGGVDGAAGGLVEEVEADHDDVEGGGGECGLEHVVGEVLGEHLADAEEAELALVAEFVEFGDEGVEAVAEFVGERSVEEIDVDVVGAEAAEGLFEGGAELGGLEHGSGVAAEAPVFVGEGGCDAEGARAADAFLGAEDESVSWAALDGAADGVFGAVGLGGVDEVDAEVEGEADEFGGVGFVASGAEAETRWSAAAESGDRDVEGGAAERGAAHGHGCGEAAGWVRAGEVMRRGFWR